MAEKLQVYNSLSGKKELFQPFNSPFVGMYVCGPTVYNEVHMGNLRTFTSFDLIYRYLKYLGYKVRYVRNITDVGHLENDLDHGEDKIAKKARLEQLEPMEIVQKYTNGFHQVLQKFNCISPSIEPTATGHIVEQIAMIKQIIANGYAYQANGSVYFDVKTFSKKHNYGQLSGRNIDEMMAGTRALEGQTEKRDALDFALWKKASKNHIMRWPSPWGDGFPGWHLECSVMSSKYLGQHFDIHGGGMDLKFPHHECEIAQNVAASNTADNANINYWLHTNMLTLNGKKMSKSDGNFILPTELLSGQHKMLEKAYNPMAVRFFLLQAHYHSTLNLSIKALDAAEKGFARLEKATLQLQTIQPAKNTSVNLGEFQKECETAMNDDFNSPVLIATLFNYTDIINKIYNKQASCSANTLKQFRTTWNALFFDVLGLKTIQTMPTTSNKTLDGLMKMIVDLRQAARQKKDFATSDYIRDRLDRLNIVIKDDKHDTTWEIDA